MPTTPLDADAIMRVSYNGRGHAHIINLRVNLVEPYTIGTDPTIMSFTGSGSNINSTALMALIVAAAKPMLLSTDHLNGWEIVDYQTDPPTWIFAGTDTTVGTFAGTDTSQPAGELTITFKDHLNKRFKHIFFATGEGVMQRLTSPAGHHFATWVTAMTAGSAGTLGDFVCGRSAYRTLAFLSGVIQTNNRWERKFLHP